MIYSEKLFCAFFSYFNGDLYNLTNDSNHGVSLVPVTEERNALSALIVSRDCYSEVVVTYPIDNQNEIRKLLAIEYEGKNVHYNIGKPIDGKTEVTVWKFHANVPSSVITVPESLLLAQTVELNSLAIVNSSPQKFIFNRINGIYSALSSTIINDAKSFLMSIGQPISSKQCLIEDGHYTKALYQGTVKLPLYRWLSFLDIKKLFKDTTLLYKTLLPAGFVFISYFAVVSMYLLISNWTLDNEIETKKSVINAVINEQAQFDHQNNKYQKINEFGQSAHPKSMMWPVIALVLEYGKITNIREVQNRIVVRGSTPSSTDLLERIVNLPYIKSAKFDSPTRTIRGNEQFVIGFELNEPSESMIFSIVKEKDSSYSELSKEKS